MTNSKSNPPEMDFDWLQANSHLLAKLPAAALQQLKKNARPRKYASGEIIYLEGDPADFAFLLVRGWVRSTRMTPDGREQALMFLRPVDAFGEIAVFARSSYPATTTALEEVIVWAIPADTLRSLLRSDPDVAEAITSMLARRILYYISLVEDLSLKSVDARLANSLLQNAMASHGVIYVPRQPWTTYDEMAIRLGTVRDVLSRAIKDMTADGLIKVTRQRIIILDPDKLAQRARQ